MRMTSIYAYGQYVCEAASFNEALERFDISSLVGVYDITDSLKGLCETRLGPWPQDGLLVHLTPADMKAMKEQEARDQDLTWSRTEAQGLAERLNEAVLEKQSLAAKLEGVLRQYSESLEANSALRSSLSHVEASVAGLVLEKQGLEARLRACAEQVKTAEWLDEQLQAAKRRLADYEAADAARQVREDEIEAQLLREAEAFTQHHPMDGIAPAVSYGEVYDESGFVVASIDEAADAPPPAVLEAPAPEAAMSFEASPRRGGRQAHPAVAHINDILREDWPAGVAISDVIARIEKEVADLPAWATDGGRLGIHATKLGLRRPDGFKRGQSLLAPRIRKAPAAPAMPGRMGVGILPPPPPVVEAPKAPALAKGEQSALTRQYGYFVEGLVTKGLSYDDIKRRMNKELPRDFSRDDVKLIVEELGI